MKIIVLDFDGTLADTRSLIVKTMQQTIAKLGLDARSDNQCAAMIGLPLRQTFTDLIPMSEEMGEKCAETYNRLFDVNNVPEAVPVFPHVVDTIKAMYEQGLTLTIASSRGRGSLVDFLKRMNLEPYVSYVVSASDIEHAKPAPDMVLKILDNVGGSKEETLVVGDTMFDIAMGRNAGVKTCGVTYGNGSRKEMADADYIIDDFADLMTIV